MGERLKDYLAYAAALAARTDVLTAEERERLSRQMLVQIGFFQHERLVHLFVTLTFGILAVGAVLLAAFMPSTALFVLCALLLVLLVPYVRHYYLLENGVQKLYEDYDALCDPWKQRK